jgi:hypothetical protein
MIATQPTLADIIQMTLDVGEDWAVAHAKRLIELVKQISGDLPYDAHVMELAAYMHDWARSRSTFKRMWNMRFVPDRWLNLTSCLICL